MTRAEFIKRSCTQCPVALFQVRVDERWDTLNVWGDPDEIEEWIGLHPYRYRPEERDIEWRIFTVHANGRLRWLIEKGLV
jgi:hypothetical protein